MGTAARGQVQGTQRVHLAAVAKTGYNSIRAEDATASLATGQAMNSEAHYG
jgi:hypothetical protein